MNEHTTDTGSEKVDGESEEWKAVLKAARKADSAYDELVKASDELAETMMLDRDLVLRRVLPTVASERRESRRVLFWVRYNELSNIKRIREHNDKQRKETERNELLAKLQLTPREKELLGIDSQANEV
jgi:transcription termination factor Rho